MTWNFAQANATTFEEMRSIGALALIRDSDLRAEVGRYYARYEDLRATVEARRTRFGPLGYELVRREWPESEEGFGDFRAADLSPEELKGLTSASVQADIRRAATAELNYSAHGAARAFELKRTATDLIVRLVEYRGGGS
jgi:hypothetical protein